MVRDRRPTNLSMKELLNCIHNLSLSVMRSRIGPSAGRLACIERNNHRFPATEGDTNASSAGKGAAMKALLALPGILTAGATLAFGFHVIRRHDVHVAAGRRQRTHRNCTDAMWLNWKAIVSNANRNSSIGMHRLVWLKIANLSPKSWPMTG
jgi:hypothetical protein